MATRKIPMRMCTACREMKPKIELMRIVKTPEGEIVTDTTGKRNGRGAYVCRSRECLAKAQKSNALGRAFGERIPEETFEHLYMELEAIERQ